MTLLEAAVAALTAAERKVAVAARNIANANTPAYKREIAFAQIVASHGSDRTAEYLPQVETSRVIAQASLVESGSAMDLAIDGEAVMLLREGERLVVTRGGQFARGLNGAMVDAQGRPLQRAGGGDVVVTEGELVIHADGTLFVDGVPAGAIGLYDATDASRALPEGGLPLEAVFVLEEYDGAPLRQGMVERSNVTLSDEMVSLMQNQRMAEAAAQIVRTYDQLTSQATATFNRGGR